MRNRQLYQFIHKLNENEKNNTELYQREIQFEYRNNQEDILKYLKGKLKSLNNS